MKRLVSLVTILALMFQLTAFGSFAAADKTVFTAVTEAYGVYVIDKNHTVVNVFTAKKLEHLSRDYNTTKFVANTTAEYKVTSIKYTLSKDKKSVVAHAVYGDKSSADYTFRKDKSGKILLEIKDDEGKVTKYAKAYANLDLALKYIKGDKFKATLKLEAALVKEIDEYNENIQALQAAYDDTAAISETNLIEGFYVGDSKSDTLDIYFAYDFDEDTYKNFVNLLSTTLTVGDDSYYVYGTDFTVEGNVMKIYEDDNNYMSLTTTDRSTITHITVVVEGKTAFDNDVNFKLDK